MNSLSRSDSVLESACQSAGVSYDDLKMPLELTLWIDPEEVVARFGEHKGSFCLLAKFKGGNKENFVHQININELEQKSIDRQRQASYELMNSRKKKYVKNGFSKNVNTALTSVHVNNNNNNITNNAVNGYDVSTSTQASNYYPFYASSSPNTKYYSTSPPQIQTSSSGLFSPNRMSPYRNFNNTSYMNASKSMIRNLSTNLRTSFDSIAPFTLSHEQTYQGPSALSGPDRFHWMNKSIVKA